MVSAPRPSSREVAGSIVLGLLIVALLWTCSIMLSPVQVAR